MITTEYGESVRCVYGKIPLHSGEDPDQGADPEFLNHFL